MRFWEEDDWFWFLVGHRFTATISTSSSSKEKCPRLYSSFPSSNLQNRSRADPDDYFNNLIPNKSRLFCWTLEMPNQKIAHIDSEKVWFKTTFHMLHWNCFHSTYQTHFHGRSFAILLLPTCHIVPGGTIDDCGMHLDIMSRKYYRSTWIIPII